MKAEHSAPTPGPEPDAAQPVSLKRVARPATVVGVGTLVAAALAGAFVAGTQVRAPTDTASPAEEVDTNVIAHVESRVVQEGLRLPGRVVAPQTLNLKLADDGALGTMSPAASGRASDSDTGKAAASEKPTEDSRGPAERNVISRVFTAPGDLLKAGTLLAEVSGRPVIAAPTGTPLYRDFIVGNSGADVLALQHMLADLGYPVDLDGVFDADTLDTAAYWYEQLGYPLPEDVDGKRGIPWREFLPLPSGSLRVSVPSGTGTVLSGDAALVVVQRGDPVIETTVDASQVTPIRDAPTVYALFDAESAATEVLSIGDLETDEDSGVSSHTVKIRCPRELIDRKGSTTVAIATERPESASLAVPVAAIDEDGASQFVHLATDTEAHETESTQDRVQIQVTAVVGGWAAIAENDELPEGTAVRVE